MILNQETLEKYGYNPINLKTYSEKNIILQCDYCNQKFEKKYCKYVKSQKYLKKDTCNIKDCINKKIKEIWGIRYPEGHPQKNKLVRNKTKNTVYSKYKVQNVAQLNSSKIKTRDTNLEKYGVEYPLQNSKILQTQINTNLQKYGVERPLQHEEFKQKQLQTCLEKYGNKHVNKIEQIK